MGLPKNIIPKGTLFKMKSGGILEVLHYENATNITVQFTDRLSDPFKAHIGNLRKGKYKNKYTPSLYGKGFEGIGRFNFKEHKFAEVAWRGILCRAYSENEKKSRPNTEDVTVCEEWHNFQNFAEWAVIQKGYGIKNFEIDKDLIILGNSTYSSEFCCYLPREINTRLPKRYSDFDKVYYYEKDNTYRAFYRNEDKIVKCISGKDKASVARLRKVAINKMIRNISEKYFNDLEDIVVKRLCNYYDLEGK